MTSHTIVPKAPYAQHIETQNRNTRETSKAKKIAIALAVIASVTGFFALLAASGVDLSPFNALSTLTISGAVGIAITSITLLVVTIIWMVGKKKRSAQNQTGSRFTFSHVDPPIFKKISGLETYTTKHTEGTNPSTVVRSTLHEVFPANYVSPRPNTFGSKGTTHYIAATSPEGEEKQESFYTMVKETEASVVISTHPMVIDPQRSPSLLQGKGTLNLGKAKIHYSPTDLGFRHSYLEIDGRKCIQIVPIQTTIIESPQTLAKAIAKIKNCIEMNGISINVENPMIVHSPEGKGSGAFLLLFELLTRLEETDGNVDAFVGSKFVEYVGNLAMHIESQMFEGAAISWASLLGNEGPEKAEKGQKQPAELAELKKLFKMYLTLRRGV